ncbi:MAG: LysR family transcriptional regulator [Alcaligenaceae bacterium]|nr:LysR family transcriptional regulator [Alcaligenaceae bacterium]
MDLTQLKSFVAVAHYGHLTQAAESLHLSQPAVTAQIKAIERNLDASLFERNTQGMKLTPAGEAFLPKAEAILQQMRELDVFALSLSSNYVEQAKLGIIQSVDRQMLSRLVNRVLELDKSLYLHIENSLSGKVLNKVRKKELDAGFFLGDNPYRTVYSIELDEVHYVLIVAAQRLAYAIENPKEFFRTVPWIERPGFSAGEKITARFWHQQKLSPQTVLVCDDVDLCIDLVASNLAITLIPVREVHRAIKAGKNIAIVPGYEMKARLSYIYPAEYETDKNSLLIRQAICDTWGVSA